LYLSKKIKPPARYSFVGGVLDEIHGNKRDDAAFSAERLDVVVPWKEGGN
jgi:hypothetical protein